MTFPRQIHQILPFFAYGDAIGNQVLELRRLLRNWGYVSEIFAENWDPRLAGECRSYREYHRLSHKDNLLILHYSTGGEANHFVLTVPDHVVIYYHNITPAHFFYWANGAVAREVEQARRELEQLAGKLPAIAASPYNAQELQGMGFTVLGVAPYILTFERLDAGLQNHGAAEIKQRFADPQAINWLYVGRLAPHKCVHDIIKAFYYYHAWITPRSRLLLVGTGTGLEHYVADLHRLTHKFGLDESVVFAGHYGAGDGLAAFYQIADLYVCMSEHEGFCIPLVEAMYYGLPVLAYASASVPFTLGTAGVMMQKKDYATIAETAHEIATCDALRSRLIAGQHTRLATFAPGPARAQFRACLDAVVACGVTQLGGIE
ncbi:MAG: glycosyltransferase family 4 protein [Chloroflexi bacterium]|nr:glycosyltransferase family 4 protein [Chloroflexota bacterium]